MINLNIKQKLLSVAALIITSFVIIGVIYSYSVGIQKEADLENSRIVNVESTIEQINIGLLQARRNEKDFLLRNDLKYAGKHANTMENNLSKVNKLRSLITDSEKQELVDELQRLFMEYQASFKTMVTIKEKVGLDEKAGLLGNLRKSVHEIEDTLEQNNRDQMAVSMLMMRRHEKDYLAREQDKYIEKMDKQQAIFSDLLNNSDLPGAVKSSLANQLSVYYRDFIALTNGMKEISKEIASMREKAHQIEPIFDKVHEMMEELSTTNRAAYQATQDRVITFMTTTLVLVGVLVMLIVWMIANGIIKAVNNSVFIAERIAQGDLKSNIEVTSSDEMGRLQQAMKTMSGKLSEIVSSVKETSQSVLQASSEISAGNMELSQRTEEQASSLEETASSMEEMTTTVKESADNAAQANTLATSTREEARKGGEVVGKAVAAMNDIKNSSRKIADIINVVEDIAFQTNLLALNAAVEAARAGEQGRGFAVVASEVRTLAGRSAESAKEIRNLIEDSVSKVQSGAELVDASGVTLNEIVTSVAKVADIVSEMAAASQEQSAGIDQVNKAVMQMDQMTQQNSALVEEAASASRSLQEQAVQLDEVIGFFKIDSARTHSNHSNVYHRDSVPTASSPGMRQGVKQAANTSASANTNATGKASSKLSNSSAKKTGTYDAEWDEF